jgi:hydroxymethylpyrimidine/phosphomethylpyrimidine kinase
MNIALTIAGSDSGGGAGIQADLKTFHRFGVFGTSVITAITAQNTLGVTEWEAVRPGLVTSQIDAVASDLRPAAFKTGMLGTADVIRVVAAQIRKHQLERFVLDPVMVATSGDLLIENEAVAAIRSHLLPLADLVTPNADEASILAGFPVLNEADMQRAALAIAVMGPKAVLVKGGHIHGDSTTAVDYLYDGSFAVYGVQSIYTDPGDGKGEPAYSYRTHLWTVDLTDKGSQPRQLTFGDRNDSGLAITSRPIFSSV